MPIEMIRKAEESDVRRVAEIHVRSWQVAYPEIIPRDYLEGLSVTRRESVWRDVIAQDRGPLFVAEEAGQIVGFCHVIPSRDPDSAGSAEISAIYVDPGSWREGHGGALCVEAIAYAREQNFARISLWVLVQNHRARRFYERMGFLEDGAFKCEERPGFVLEEVRYRRRTVDCDPPDDADLSRTDSKDAL